MWSRLIVTMCCIAKSSLVAPLHFDFAAKPVAAGTARPAADGNVGIDVGIPWERSRPI
jgi:hypothetical protein